MVKKQTTLKTSVFASIVSFLGINGDQAGYIMLGVVGITLLVILAISFAKDKKSKQNAPQPIDISDKKQPAQKAEQKVAEQPKVAVQTVAQPVVATQTPASENDEVLKGIEEGTGLAIVARYKWSFMARLIQAPDEIKGFYSDLKNQLLSYNKVSSRVSTSFDSINLGRKGIAKFNVRGKTLYLYLALDPAELADTKYGIEDVSSKKKYASVPVLLKIKGDRKFKYALELIDKMCAEKMELPKRANAEDVDYRIAYQTTEELVEAGIVKKLAAGVPTGDSEA